MGIVGTCAFIPMIPSSVLNRGQRAGASYCLKSSPLYQPSCNIRFILTCHPELDFEVDTEEYRLDIVSCYTVLRVGTKSWVTHRVVHGGPGYVHEFISSTWVS